MPMKSFVPGPYREREFRDVLGCFATGVTVVTTATPAGPVGITANSFASVSLDPPIVLWSISRHSTRFEAFAECENFAVHVLGAEQLELGRRFARSGDAFAGLAVGENEAGTPLLTECLSRFECSRIAVHDGGDHLIVLGQVAVVTLRDGEPLLFAGGEYGRFDRFSSPDRLRKEAGNFSGVCHEL
jgi:flavin reductase (DIM6/NTAB) family NADH-FMN oxidoreductase RutF